MAVVKANAYGHGLVETAGIALEAGADWLGVFSVREGAALRGAGVEAPVLVLGPSSPADETAGVEADLRLTVASLETAARVAHIGRGNVHLKVETGTHRQGLRDHELLQAASLLTEGGVAIEGAYTHFADIEDTTDHAFAELQLKRFKEQMARLGEAGVRVPLPHTACSAATILFPDTYFEMVRVGISLYGLWPSRETLVSAKALGRNAMELRPVMTWKTRISQIKSVEPGAYVGYGRTFRATRVIRLAILPVGYADGYDRRLSGSSYVLVGGMRAPVLGRICMNLMMVDITDIPGAAVGDEVVLLGCRGHEMIAAEQLASLAGTINYEIVTRAAPGAPRIVVSK